MSESKMILMHHLSNTTGISPISSTYTMSTKEFLEQVHALLHNELGKNIAEINLETGSEVEMQMFLKNSSQALSGPDSKVWSLCDLLQQHHEYPVFSGTEFAAELTGRLFKVNRLFVEHVRVTDDWKHVYITITVKPKDRYFLVIHPDSDFYLFVYRVEGDAPLNTGRIKMTHDDDKAHPISVWRHDALEITKREYEALREREKTSVRARIEAATSVMENHLKGRRYTYYLDVNPNSGQYREIYSVSPLQKITDSYIDAFDELRGELKTLHRDQNFRLNMDFAELSSDEFDCLLDIAMHGSVHNETYIQTADRIIQDRQPIYGNLNRRDIFDIAGMYSFWNSLYEREDPLLVQEGFLAYLLEKGQGAAIESILNRISSHTTDFEELCAFLWSWVSTQKREQTQQFTKAQIATLELFHQALSEIIDHCSDDSFNNWLSDQDMFTCSVEDILKRLPND